MLILILMFSIQRKPFFSFEKGSIGQNHSSSSSHHPIKKFPHNKISDDGDGAPLWNWAFSAGEMSLALAIISANSYEFAAISRCFCKNTSFSPADLIFVFE